MIRHVTVSRVNTDSRPIYGLTYREIKVNHPDNNLEFVQSFICEHLKTY